MPINTVPTDNAGVKYYKLRRLQREGFDYKEPCFVQYNKETKTEEFVSYSFGGELYQVELKEPKVFTSSKSGQEFTSQDVAFTFVSQDNLGNNIKEILQIDRNTTLLETLVAKIIFAESYHWLDLQVGRFKPKNSTTYRDFLSVMQNGMKLPSMIGVNHPEYPLPKGAIEIPKKVYLDVKKKELDPDTKKMIYVDGKEIDPNWIAQKDEIFDKAIDDLIAKVDKWAKDHPKDFTIKQQPETTPQGENLVDIDTDVIGVTMPF